MSIVLTWFSSTWFLSIATEKQCFFLENVLHQMENVKTQLTNIYHTFTNQPCNREKMLVSIKQLFWSRQNFITSQLDMKCDFYITSTLFPWLSFSWLLSISKNKLCSLWKPFFVSWRSLGGTRYKLYTRTV